MLKFISAIFLACSFLLTGCVNGNHGYTKSDSFRCDYRNQYGSVHTEKDKNNTLRGAAYGTLAGAILGQVTGSRNTNRTMKGAALGALIGTGIGYYQDRQEQKMRAVTRGTGIDVKRHGDKLKLIMPGHVTFETNSYVISSDFYYSLDKVINVMNEYPDTRLSIQGHTDSSGQISYNQQLSELRAYSVLKYFQSNGIAFSRLSAVGYGQHYPLASNNTHHGKQMNRRVEIEITPL